jgi:sugar phosphate isomerase/epimerase
MPLHRRQFLHVTAGLAGASLGFPLRQAVAAAPAARIRIGSCRLGLEDAQRAGLDGVEISAGGAADTLAVADPAVRQKYKAQMQATGLAISSFMMGVLNSHPLATEPRAPAWLEQAIDAARDLGAKVILVAFFGKGDLQADGKPKAADVDVVVRRLRAAAPQAEKAGVALAIENRLTARQNVELLERIGSPAARIYYDVGNTTALGYDAAAEIRFLRERIVCVHFKDGPHYLGEGKVPYPPIAAALKDIGYQGWIVLETSNPSTDGVADARRNADFVRRLFGMA